MREEKSNRIVDRPATTLFPIACTLLVAVTWLALCVPAAARSLRSEVGHPERNNSKAARSLDPVLLKAAEVGDPAKVRCLSALWANANTTQKSGWTALMLAASFSVDSVGRFVYIAADSMLIKITPSATSFGHVFGAPVIVRHYFRKISATRPPIPTKLTASGGDGWVSLAWEPSPGATSYNIYRHSATDGYSYTQIAKSVAHPYYADVYAANGVTYAYVVTAVGVDGESRYSKPVQSSGISPRAIDRKLLKAVQIGDLTKVKALLAGGANVNAAQENGWTALMLAAQASKTSVAKYLIEHGADVHRRSVLYNDVDALVLAAQAGNVAICRMLINHGANVNEADVDGATPLMYIAGNSNLPPPQVYQTTKYLLSRGANVQIKDKHGNTALSGAQAAAKMYPNLKPIVRLLKAAGAR